MGLLSRFNRQEKAALHSHAMAAATDRQAQTIGSTNSTTFEQRKEIDRRRQHVAGYQTAGIVTVGADELPSSRVKTKNQPKTDIDIVRPTRQRYNAESAVKTSRPPLNVPPRRSGFQEPQSRGYNPYA